MAWGVAETDRRDLEGFIEGTQEGVYTRFGYTAVHKVEVTLEESKNGKCDAWLNLQRQKLPIRYTALWRPRKGDRDRDSIEIWNQRHGKNFGKY